MNLPTPREPTILQAALGGRCPRCGDRAIFKGVITVNFRCRACGLDLSRSDIGDGPALGVVAVLTVLISAVAIWTEITFKPDYWLHVLLWPTLLIGLSIAIIRPLKAAIIAIGYAYHSGKLKL